MVGVLHDVPVQRYFIQHSAQERIITRLSIPSHPVVTRFSPTIDKQSGALVIRDHDVAKQALLCHKEPAQGTQVQINSSLSLFFMTYGR